MPSSTPGSCFKNVNTSCVYTDLLYFLAHDFRLGQARAGWALCAPAGAPAPCESWPWAAAASRGAGGRWRPPLSSQNNNKKTPSTFPSSCMSLSILKIPRSPNSKKPQHVVRERDTSCNSQHATAPHRRADVALSLREGGSCSETGTGPGDAESALGDRRSRL